MTSSHFGHPYGRVCPIHVSDYIAKRSLDITDCNLDVRTTLLMIERRKGSDTKESTPF